MEKVKEWLFGGEQREIKANKYLLEEEEYNCGCIFIKVLEEGRVFRNVFHPCKYHKNLELNKEKWIEKSKQAQLSNIGPLGSFLKGEN